MSSERYLVTGAGGFIGANLVRNLHNDGREVIAGVHGDSNWRLEGLSGLRTVKIDITNQEDLIEKLKLIDPTHIINLATYGVYRDQNSQEITYEVNVTGTKNLLAAILELSGLEKFISTGSVFEYGSLPGKVSEDTQGEIRNEYDKSKQTVTNILKEFSITNHIPVATLRLFTAYGQMEDPRRLIASSIIKALKNRKITVSDAIRDFINIDDVTYAYVSVLDAQLKTGEVYNVGSGVSQSVISVVQKICEIVGNDVEIQVNNEFLPVNDSKCYADIGKINKDFGWKPKIDIEEGLQQTVDWYKTNLTKYKHLYE